MSMQLVASPGPGTPMASGPMPLTNGGPMQQGPPMQGAPMMLQNGGHSPSGSYAPVPGSPMMLQNGGHSPSGSVMMVQGGNGSFSMPTGQMVAANGSFSMPSGQMVAAPNQMVAYNQPPMTTAGPGGSSMVLAPPPTGPQMGSSIAFSGGGSPMAISGMSPGFGAIMPSNASMADIAVGEEGRTTLPVRLRETEALDSKDLGSLPAGTNFTVQLVAGRRILITATNENMTGWISTRSQEGQPLIAKFGPAVGAPVFSQQQMQPPPFRPQSPVFQPRSTIQVGTPIQAYAAPPPIRMSMAEIPVAVSARNGTATYQAPPAPEAKGGGWLSWFQGDIAFDGARGVAPEWTRRHGMMEYKNGASYAAVQESPRSVQSIEISPYAAPAPQMGVVGTYQQPGSSVIYQQPGSSVYLPQPVQYRPGSSVMVPVY